MLQLLGELERDRGGEKAAGASPSGGGRERLSKKQLARSLVSSANLGQALQGQDGGVRVIVALQAGRGSRSDERTTASGQRAL